MRLILTLTNLFFSILQIFYSILYFLFCILFYLAQQFPIIMVSRQSVHSRQPMQLQNLRFHHVFPCDIILLYAFTNFVLD